MKNRDYILANLEFSGFYRVNYDSNNWNAIIKQLIDNHEVGSRDYIVTDYTFWF